MQRSRYNDPQFLEGRQPEYTYEGFSAGNTRFKNVSVDSDEAALYVLSNGTLAQAKAKAPNAKIVIHDIVETEFEDNLGQTKKKVSGTISVVIPGETVTVRPVVTPKPSMNSITTRNFWRVVNRRFPRSSYNYKINYTCHS